MADTVTNPTDADLENNDLPTGNENPDKGSEDATEDLDFDQAETKAARAALAEEEGKAGEDDAAEGEPEPTDPDKTAEGDDGEDPSKISDDGDGDSHMIPKGRLDKALQGKQDAEKAAAYWKGVADSKTATHEGNQDGTQDTPQETEPTPDEIIARAEEQLLQVADDYESGDLSERERTQKQIELNREIQDAREQKVLAIKTGDAGGDGGNSESLYLDELTSEIEAAHPFVHEIKDQSRWDFLQSEAISLLRAEGVAIAPGDRGTITLRRKMAELTDKYGPLWTGKTREELAAGKDTDTSPATGNDGGNAELSPAAKDRLAKLNAADKHPPDTSSLGAAGDSDEISEAQLNAMSDDEIAALPERQRRKFLAG